jgi:hypothetical protein
MTVKRRMKGAANRTIGDINTHDKSQDPSQWLRNDPSVRRLALAIAAAIALVKPDWMMPNKK